MLLLDARDGEYKEALKLNKNSVEIDNGINTDILENDLKNLNIVGKANNKLNVCTIGRICNQKNPKSFNNIAVNLKDNNFMWIGDGEERNELKADNITITGWKKREDVIIELEKNDVFILTSLWEGLPYSLLEAMYMQKVCIVSDCIGNRDVILNNQNGFIAKTDEDFVRIIKQIENKEIDISKIKAESKKEIETKYSLSIMSKKYMNLYSDINYK